jgi:DNA-directed RNA polymerase subunit RPC12/RpoP
MLDKKNTSSIMEEELITLRCGRCNARLLDHEIIIGKVEIKCYKCGFMTIKKYNLLKDI